MDTQYVKVKVKTAPILKRPNIDSLTEQMLLLLLLLLYVYECTQSTLSCLMMDNYIWMFQ
jgi:hypothetical protein